LEYGILTLPRAFDLRARTVKCRLVSERQLQKEVVTASRTLFLRFSWGNCLQKKLVVHYLLTLMMCYSIWSWIFLI